MTYGHFLDGGRPLGLPRFFSRFSDEDLATVWKFSGLPGDYQGRIALARFLEPIPNSWRDIAYRALRTGDRGRSLALMLALLRMRQQHRPPRARRPVVSVRTLVPQIHAGRITPARAP